MGESSDKLPSGEVTFVFTDIEGSTRLLRSLGRRYDAILQRHREILRSAWTEFSGHEMGTEGDSFFVSFGDVNSALVACRAAQHNLAQAWSGDPVLRVRMGIHRGLAYPRAGEYVALAVHRAARISAAAHGGQILVSDEAASALRPELRSKLFSLGRFRVRDFDDPVDISAVDLSTQESKRVPRLIPAEGHNLVRPLSALIGRGDELAEVRSLLASGCVVSILGPGGVGKTRLAIDVGHSAIEDWIGGIWFVELGSVRDPSLIAAAIAEAIGASDVGSAEVWDSIVAHFGDEQVMLVLDNCEHLYPSVASAVNRLLGQCRGLGILATSRESLGLMGERVFRLRPLDTETSGEVLSLAAQLFCERSGLDAVEPSERAAVIALCESLDGLPLAIELAAGRAGNWSPAEILEAVQERPSSIATRDPDLPGRHTSLTRALEWSLDLLSGDEAKMLHRLSVFASSFDVELAGVAASDTLDQELAPDLLWSLTDKSLIEAERAAGDTRYRLLNTVRIYAAGPTAPAAEPRALLVSHYLSTLGPGQADDIAWTGRIALELDNVRSLAQLPTGQNQDECQQLAWAIGRYHDATDQFSIGIAELESLAATLQHASADRVALLTLLADLYLRLDSLGDEASWDPLERAKSMLDDAEALAARVGVASWDDAGIARTRGTIALREGDPARALAIAEAALATDLSPRGRARIYSLLGVAAGHSGDTERAVQALTRELELWETLGLDTFAGHTHGNLAEALLQSDPQRAAHHQLQSLDLALALGQRLSVAFSMVVAAHLAAISEQWAESLTVQGAADALLEELQFSLFPPDQRARRALLEEASAHKRADEVEDLLSTGRQISRSEATSMARRVLQRTTGDEDHHE